MSIRHLNSDIPQPLNLGHFDVTFKVVHPGDKYDLNIDLIDQNRDITPSKVKKLKAKIGKRGFLRTAIVVVTSAFVEDGNDQVPQNVLADGQHGVEAAQKSNSQYYVMELEPKLEFKDLYDDPAEVMELITELNTDVNNWKPWQFIISFAKGRGRKYSGYRFMRTLKEKNALFVQADVAALCCDGVTSLPNKLKKGDFQIPSKQKEEINALALQLNRIENMRPFGSDGSISRMRNSIIKVMRKFANLEGYNVTYQQMADFIGSQGVYKGYREADDPIEWNRDMTDLRRQLETTLVRAHKKGIFKAEAAQEKAA